MDTASLARLLLLAAIWGASFLFMRVAAPVMGPVPLIFMRVGLAALFLLAVAARLRRPLEVARHGRHYLLLGLLNSALPFLLFAFAARTVSASLLSVLNATAPIWAALIGALWTRQGLAPRQAGGMLLGLAGVTLLAGVEALVLPRGGWLAVLAGLGAAFSYGLATNYAKRAAPVEPMANAHGSMWAATLWLLPFMAVVPVPAGTWTPWLASSVILLGVLCSGVAYLLYFRLIADLGAARALTVTYLIPLFGILWGNLFLGETMGWHTVMGCVAVLTGTALVTGFSLGSVFPRRVGHGA